MIYLRATSNELAGFGGVGQDRQTVIFHLGDAALNCILTRLSAGQIKAKWPGAELGEERGVIGENAQKPVDNRHDRLRHGFINHLLFRRNHDAIECHADSDLLFRRKQTHRPAGRIESVEHPAIGVNLPLACWRRIAANGRLLANFAVIWERAAKAICDRAAGDVPRGSVHTAEVFC